MLIFGGVVGEAFLCIYTYINDLKSPKKNHLPFQKFEAPDLSIGTFFSTEAAIFLILGIS